MIWTTVPNCKAKEDLKADRSFGLFLWSGHPGNFEVAWE